MIILLAGTRDGRDIARQLIEDGYDILITTVSEYGGYLAAESGAEVVAKPLSADDLSDLITRKSATKIIDCTHPYACQVSAMAQSVAVQKEIRYIRYERPISIAAAVEGLHYMRDWTEAAEQAAGLGETIFLTTGSRNLATFLQHPAIHGKRVIARVLPEPEVVSLCRSLGMLPRDIIAMQGPFSHALNKAMFHDCGAQVIVTKDAGDIGGTDTKLAAARDLGLPVVVVGRPQIEYSSVVSSYNELKSLLSEVGK
jgi:precorrin-6A/cobalt-precorrin-6A reductase